MYVRVCLKVCVFLIVNIWTVEIVNICGIAV